MVKWMLGFAIIAVFSLIALIAFQIPAAGVVAIVSFVLAGLLFAGRFFERAASL